MRTPHTPGGYQTHAKDLFFHFVSYTKVGVLISFSGHLGVWGVLVGVWGVLAGVWGVLAGSCQSPRALGLDMSIRRGLGYSGRALGCEGGR